MRQSHILILWAQYAKQLCQREHIFLTTYINRKKKNASVCLYCFTYLLRQLRPSELRLPYIRCKTRCSGTLWIKLMYCQLKKGLSIVDFLMVFSCLKGCTVLTGSLSIKFCIYRDTVKNSVKEWDCHHFFIFI